MTLIRKISHDIKSHFHGRDDLDKVPVKALIKRTDSSKKLKEKRGSLGVFHRNLFSFAKSSLQRRSSERVVTRTDLTNVARSPSESMGAAREKSMSKASLTESSNELRKVATNHSLRTTATSYNGHNFRIVVDTNINIGST